MNLFFWFNDQSFSMRGICFLTFFALVTRIHSYSCTDYTQCLYWGCSYGNGDSLSTSGNLYQVVCACVNYLNRYGYSYTDDPSLFGTCNNCVRYVGGIGWQYCPDKITCATSCPAGQYLNECPCQDCPAGSFCTGNNLKSLCPAGTYNSNTGSSSSTDCITCAAGTYSEKNTGSSICLTCPTGKYGDTAGRTICTDCTATCSGDTYESTGCTSTTNRVCTPIQSCSTLAECQYTGCQIGNYYGCNRRQISWGFHGVVNWGTTAARDAYCIFSYDDGGTWNYCSLRPCATSCPSGQYISNCVCKPCASCATNQYQQSACTVTNNTVCVGCPPNHYCNGVSATGCTSVCATNQYETSACTSTTNRICGACPGNSYCNGVSAITCSGCSDGTYQIAACNSTMNTMCSTCTPICTVPGTYQLSDCTPLTNRICSVCTNLVANAYYIGVGINYTNCPFSCNQGYYLSSGQCLDCIANNWCSGNILNACPNNAISPPLSTSQNQCLCKPGYYGNGSRIGTSPCQICIVGSYCPGGNNNVSYSCPVNFTSNEGSSQLSDCYCNPGYQLIANECKLCPPATFCASGILSSCPSNSYSPSGSSANSSCVCNPGFYGSNGGICAQCPANSYCTGGNSTALCTTNAISPVQSTNASACYCDRGYQGVGNAACIACPAGTWCWTGILNYCPTNSSSPPLSSYWYNCTCMPGFTGPDGMACAPCAPGTYKGYNGSDACALCPLNSTCSQGARIPVPCPLGEYYCNGITVQNCNPICLSGTYETKACTSIQNRVCMPCSPESFSLENQSICTNCKKCGPGTYQSSPCTVSVDRKCAPCPAGSACFGDGSVESCIVNLTFSVGNQSKCTNCTKCGPGTYQSSPCTVSVDRKCAPCPAGSFSNFSNSYFCFDCQVNTYCPVGSTGGTPCPENSISKTGSYNISNCTASDGYFGPVGGPFIPYGSTDITHCIVNSGYFSPPGGNFTLCTANYYCPSGSTAPIPCPNNLSSLPGAFNVSDCKIFDCAPGLYLLQSSCVACPQGTYCPQSSKQPTPCKTCNHVFLSKCDGIGLANDTATCACNPGFYLSDPNSNNSQCSACPLYTTSAANNTDTTVLSCTCLAGYTCKYTKRIQGVIKLNMTLSDFTATAQDALKIAIAQAAGVDVSQVSIVSISSGSSNRRLLGTLAEENTLTVTVRINDSQNAHIRKLSKFSVVSHENSSASSTSESIEKEEQGESSSWQLLRAFSHHAHASKLKMITQHFDILSEVWTPNHSIQVSKL
jgi:hypothetical protein